MKKATPAGPEVNPDDAFSNAYQHACQGLAAIKVLMFAHTDCERSPLDAETICNSLWSIRDHFEAVAAYARLTE